MSDPVKPIISKPITQTQLDLCRAALNIAAHQCNLTATLVMGRNEQRTAEHFAQAAIAHAKPGPVNRDGAYCGQ